MHPSGGKKGHNGHGFHGLLLSSGTERTWQSGHRTCTAVLCGLRIPSGNRRHGRKGSQRASWGSSLFPPRGAKRKPTEEPFGSYSVGFLRRASRSPALPNPNYGTNARGLSSPPLIPTQGLSTTREWTVWGAFTECPADGCAPEDFGLKASQAGPEAATWLPEIIRLMMPLYKYCPQEAKIPFLPCNRVLGYLRARGGLFS